MTSGFTWRSNTPSLPLATHRDRNASVGGLAGRGLRDGGRKPGGLGGHTSCGTAEIGHRRNLDALVERSASRVQLTNQHEKNVSAFP